MKLFDKKTLITIAIFAVVLLIAMKIGMEYDNSDKSYEKSIESTENTVIQQLYAPFKVTYEFDIKNNDEENGQDVGYELTLLIGGNDSYDDRKITLPENKIAKDETHHYKVEFGAVKWNQGNKSFTYRVKDGENRIIQTGYSDSPDHINPINAGVKIYNANVRIENAKFYRGGITITYGFILFFVVYAVALGIVVLPKVERTLIGEVINKKMLIRRLINLTIIDLVILVNLVLFKTTFGNFLVELLGIEKMAAYLISSKLIVEVLCVVLLALAIKSLRTERIAEKLLKKNEISTKEYIKKCIPLCIVHFVMVILGLTIAAFIVAIYNAIAGLITFALFGCCVCFTEISFVPDEDGGWILVFWSH